MISDTKFINRVLIDTSVEQRFKLIKKGFFNVVLIALSQPGSLNSIHMFKKWATLCLVHFCTILNEMRIKEEKNALRSFLLLLFLFLNPD